MHVLVLLFEEHTVWSDTNLRIVVKSITGHAATAPVRNYIVFPQYPYGSSFEFETRVVSGTAPRQHRMHRDQGILG